MTFLKIVKGKEMDYCEYCGMLVSQWSFTTVEGKSACSKCCDKFRVYPELANAINSIHYGIDQYIETHREEMQAINDRLKQEFDFTESHNWDTASYNFRIFKDFERVVKERLNYRYSCGLTLEVRAIVEAWEKEKNEKLWEAVKAFHKPSVYNLKEGKVTLWDEIYSKEIFMAFMEEVGTFFRNRVKRGHCYDALFNGKNIGQIYHRYSEKASGCHDKQWLSSADEDQIWWDRKSFARHGDAIKTLLT